MNIEIPDVRIVDRPESLQLGGDPLDQFAISCQAAAFTIATAFKNVDLVEVPSMDVIVDDEHSDCYTQFLDVDGHALVICVPFSDDETPDGTGYLYVRAGKAYSPWRVATKMLVLPFGFPEGWGDADAAVHQRNGRVMLYVALATIHNWFASEQS